MQAGDDCSLAQFWRVLPSLRRSDIGLGVDASGGRTATLLGWLITAVVALVFDADVLHAGCLDVGEGGGVSVVAVDSHERGAFGGGDVVEDDVAFAHGLAVTARAIAFGAVGVSGVLARSIAKFFWELMKGRNGAAEGEKGSEAPWQATCAGYVGFPIRGVWSEVVR